MRSEKQYENFVLHIEWRHMEAGREFRRVRLERSPVRTAEPASQGVEVQMLELEWANLNKRKGVTPPVAYVHGELFGVGGVKTMPDNPRGDRSKSIENRAKGKGEWNAYDVVAVDGSIKLSVNGKFVNGISRSTQKKGYLCLEYLGWLVVLVVALGFPFVVDALGRLTYAWSLAFWGIPILYLIPLFLTLTADGHGRRRRALMLTVGLIVGLGVVLDFLSVR